MEGMVVVVYEYTEPYLLTVSSTFPFKVTKDFMVQLARDYDSTKLDPLAHPRAPSPGSTTILYLLCGELIEIKIRRCS